MKNLKAFNESTRSEYSLSIEDLISMIRSRSISSYNVDVYELEYVMDVSKSSIIFTPDKDGIAWGNQHSDKLDDLIVIFDGGKPVGVGSIYELDEVTVMNGLVVCTGCDYTSIFDKSTLKWKNR